MKWWKQAVLFLAMVVVVVGSLLVYRAVANQRDLRETLLWIDQTYNPHEGGDNGGQGHGRSSYFLEKSGVEEIIEKFEMTVIQNGSCNVIIHEQNPAVGVENDISNDTTFTVSLRDLDPGSIKTKTYGKATAEIEFLTRNGAPVINEEVVSTFLKLSGSDHESKHISKANHAFLIVDDAPYAKRLEKALKHAVELCDGKASKF